MNGRVHPGRFVETEMRQHAWPDAASDDRSGWHERAAARKREGAGDA
jgi:hypothetical protein